MDFWDRVGRGQRSANTQSNLPGPQVRKSGPKGRGACPRAPCASRIPFTSPLNAHLSNLPLSAATSHVKTARGPQARRCWSSRAGGAESCHLLPTGSHRGCQTGTRALALWAATSPCRRPHLPPALEVSGVGTLCSAVGLRAGALCSRRAAPLQRARGLAPQRPLRDRKNTGNKHQ